jgi:hypothetical protein
MLLLLLVLQVLWLLQLLLLISCRELNMATAMTRPAERRHQQ